MGQETGLYQDVIQDVVLAFLIFIVVVRAGDVVCFDSVLFCVISCDLISAYEYVGGQTGRGDMIRVYISASCLKGQSSRYQEREKGEMLRPHVYPTKFMWSECIEPLTALCELFPLSRLVYRLDSSQWRGRLCLQAGVCGVGMLKALGGVEHYHI